MSAARQYADELCEQMKEGDRQDFDGRFFREAYPTNPVTGAPTIDRFLESKVAANYGAWRCTHDPLRDVYTVSRHPVGKTRVREDFDRR